MTTTRQPAIRLVFVCTVLLLAGGCSTVLYQGTGSYSDDEGVPREILLQWSAQKYFLFPNRVDYGSVSLQAECVDDVFLDHRNDPTYGFIFVERPQDYRPAPGAPTLRLGNDLICAHMSDNRQLRRINRRTGARLVVLCESRTGASSLPPNLNGYVLTVDEGESQKTLLCPE